MSPFSLKLLYLYVRNSMGASFCFPPKHLYLFPTIYIQPTTKPPIFLTFRHLSLYPSSRFFVFSAIGVEAKSPVTHLYYYSFSVFLAIEVKAQSPSTHLYLQQFPSLVMVRVFTAAAPVPYLSSCLLCKF